MALDDDQSGQWMRGTEHDWMFSVFEQFRRLMRLPPMRINPNLSTKAFNHFNGMDLDTSTLADRSECSTMVRKAQWSSSELMTERALIGFGVHPDLLRGLNGVRGFGVNVNTMQPYGGVWKSWSLEMTLWIAFTNSGSSAAGRAPAAHCSRESFSHATGPVL